MGQVWYGHASDTPQLIHLNQKFCLGHPILQRVTSVFALLFGATFAKKNRISLIQAPFSRFYPLNTVKSRYDLIEVSETIIALKLTMIYLLAISKS